MVLESNPIEWRGDIGKNTNILVIDVGGTYIKYGVYNMTTQVLGLIDKVKTPMSGLEDFIETIKK